MATYHQMLAQIAELKEKAEAQRARELAEVIADMREKIRDFGITAKDLGFKSLDAPPSVATKRPPRPPKYRDPKTGAVWSGMGKPPLWISAASNRDKFLIATGEEPAVAEKPAAKKAGKQASQAPAKKAAKSKVAAAPAKKAAAKKTAAKRGAAASEQSAAAGAADAAAE
jgi:DNA-binding protein H-NS